MDLLQRVLKERVPFEEDSENDKGEKVYIKERCKQYNQLLAEIERKKEETETRRKRTIEENKKLAALGRKLIKPEEPYKPSETKLASRIRNFEQEFYIQ